MQTTSVATSPADSAPRLSIIIATWNAARTLERCLHSIAGQDFTDWELLIADGASTDGTMELIRKYEAHVSWWRSQKDDGIYDAWNHALVHARGEYVCFLGADDAWADNTVLARLFTAIGAEQYDLVSSLGLIYDSVTGKGFTFGSAWDYQRIGRRMILCHPGLFHRRSLFEQYGLFDTRYRIAGDLDFLLRMPANVRTLHLACTSVLIEAAGVSRRNVLARLREQRDVLANCTRYGSFRAYLAWADKLWRYPFARFFNIPH
jgi:glycosyltransferase involved in cell wall biosynthesis